MFIEGVQIISGYNMAQKRAPTPYKERVDPMYEIHNTLYPYINFKDSGLTPYLNSFRRAISSINPFALQQIPTSSSAAIGPKKGSGWYSPDSYPNGVHFDTTWPSHYDPLANPRRGYTYGVRHPTGPSSLPGFKVERVPRFCARQLSFYSRCLVSNDENENLCAEEQNNVLAICPSFALDALKEKKLKYLKRVAINDRKYRESMQVSDYNLGRTIANVPKKTWKDGAAENLRPDTLWADERYVDITQSEINAAKERIQQRKKASGVKADATLHTVHFDRTQAEAPKEVPLYP